MRGRATGSLVADRAGDTTTFALFNLQERGTMFVRPGLRVYKASASIPQVQNGLGVAIVTNPKGVMTDRKARASGVGGEVLCYFA